MGPRAYLTRKGSIFVNPRPGSDIIAEIHKEGGGMASTVWIVRGRNGLEASASRLSDAVAMWKLDTEMSTSPADY